MSYALFLMATLEVLNWLETKRRPACTFPQSDQCLCFSRFRKYLFIIYTCYKRIFHFLAVSVAEQPGLCMT